MNTCARPRFAYANAGSGSSETTRLESSNFSEDHAMDSELCNTLLRRGLWRISGEMEATGLGGSTHPPPNRLGQFTKGSHDPEGNGVTITWFV